MKTFSNQIVQSGSNCISINVSHNNVPFGIIRTFRDTKTDQSPWQAIPLKGLHKDFWGIAGKPATKKEALEFAKQYMASL